MTKVEEYVNPTSDSDDDVENDVAFIYEFLIDMMFSFCTFLWLLRLVMLDLQFNFFDWCFSF